MKVTLSNQLESLFDGLKAKLYRKGRSPFEPILVVVPSFTMKQWLMRSLANDPQIGLCFGFKIATQWEAVQDLLSDQSMHLPHKVELALEIESFLQEKGLWKENNRTDAALGLADLIQQYGACCGPEIKTWLSDPKISWQKELWRKLYGPDSIWKTVEQVMQDPSVKNVPAHIHLFGFSSLPDALYHLFTKLSLKTPVNLWALTCSRMFWSDLKTEKEQERLLSEMGSSCVTTSFEEDNALIASNGKWGRLFRQRIEGLAALDEHFLISSALYPSFNEYIVEGIHSFPEAEPTLLHAVQADLVCLRPNAEPIAFQKSERAIEMHAAPSLLREVEIARDIVLRAFKDDGMQPGDVLILAPHLEQFGALIQSVFTQGEIPIPICIAGQTTLGESSYVSLIWQLAKLVEKDWELQSLYEFLKSKQLKLPFYLTQEELKETSELFTKAGVRNYRDLKKAWNGILQSFSKVVSPIEFMENEAIPDVTLVKAAYSEGEVLGNWMENLHALKSDLSFLEEKVSRKSSEWCILLLTLLEKRFLANGDEDKEAEKGLKHILRQLKEWSSPTLISCSSFFTCIKEMCQQHMLRKEIQGSAVRLMPLPSRPVPSKLIILIGMDHLFPRENRQNPFQFLPEARLPKPSEEDRYLFLESLLSARKKFVMTFSDTGQGYSIIVDELLKYLDQRYTLGGIQPSQAIFFRHPPFACDSSYFLDGYLQSFSTNDFRKACALKGPLALKNDKFFLPPYDLGLYHDRIPEQINLAELRNALFNPIKHFFNRGLDLYLNEAHGVPGFLEEFEKDSLWDSEWLKWALRFPVERVAALAEKLGRFPAGPWENCSKHALKAQLVLLLESIQKLGLSFEEFFEIEFSHDIHKPISSGLRWKFPALRIPFRGRIVKVTGILPYATRKGIVSLREKKFETSLTSWPEWLLYHSVPDEFCQKNIFYLKNGLVEPLEDVKPWEKLLDHYLQTLLQPTPFYPSWVEPISRKDPHALQKSIEQSNRRDDLYIKWMEKMPQAFDLHTIFSWEKLAENLIKGVE